VLAWEHTPEALARQLGRAEDIAQECAAADAVYREEGPAAEAFEAVFEARPGPQCAWCDFRAHCPEGRAATESRLPWDGLAPRAVTPV
jgi:putative RecB family exonuclease